MASLPFDILCLKLGRVMRRLRAQAGYSQADFASAVGVHRTYMGLIERGKTNPSLLILYNAAQRLGLNVPELFQLTLTEDTSSPLVISIVRTPRNTPRRGAGAQPRVPTLRKI